MMDFNYKGPGFSGKITLISLIAGGTPGILSILFIIMAGFLIGLSTNFELGAQEAEAGLGIEERPENGVIIYQQNTLIPVNDPAGPEPKVVQRVKIVLTAYSSSTFETDENPHITAAGTLVRDGIIANNYFPFGTKIRIPEIYGDKVFVVEDRMSWKKGNYHFDVWFPSYSEALNFGAKNTYIEILES